MYKALYILKYPLSVMYREPEELVDVLDELDSWVVWPQNLSIRKSSQQGLVWENSILSFQHVLWFR